MLTSHAEEYLEAIYRLGGQAETVPLSTLAEYLELSAGSVNEMVRRLEEQGLVDYTPYRGVRLARDGLCKALAVIRRHRLWERFLTDMLGLPWDAVHHAACQLEHAASEEVTERLAVLLDNPQCCPHGRPMPQPDCERAPSQEAVPLTALAAGQCATVAYIGREDPALLRYLGQLRIRPGAEIAIDEIAPFDGPLTVRIAGAAHMIGRSVAETVHVRAAIAAHSAALDVS
ncbi:MAG: metal-dependent transcriptional regulator [Anaerolineae bacterium]|nr:metal-dependent transcriptional regulator [Anaerolineae bacterium]